MSKVIDINTKKKMLSKKDYQDIDYVYEWDVFGDGMLMCHCYPDSDVFKSKYKRMMYRIFLGSKITKLKLY